MNPYGHFCEGLIRELLPEIGIPHKHQTNGRSEHYWWASEFEDHSLGLDCWLTLDGFGEVAVDFTVISDRNAVLLKQKIETALARGVVLVVFEQGMIWRARNGSQTALIELEQELRLQIAHRISLLNGNRMTRQKAEQIKAAHGRTPASVVFSGKTKSQRGKKNENNYRGFAVPAENFPQRTVRVCHYG